MSELDAIPTLVGRMTVGDLARHLDMSVAELVAIILEPGRPSARTRRSARRTERPASPRAATSARAAAKAKPRSARASASTGDEPTRNELHEAVDRWILGEILDEEGGNISQTADRLGVNRKRVRERWAKVRDLEPDLMMRCFGRMRGGPRPPSRTTLRALGSLNEIHAAVDRWMITHVLRQEGGNVTLTAQRLGTSRRLVRDLRARIHHK